MSYKKGGIKMKNILKNSISLLFGLILSYGLNGFIKQKLLTSNSLAQYQFWVVVLIVFLVVWPCLKFAVSSKVQKQKALEKIDKERLFNPFFSWRYATTLYLIMSCFFNWSSSFTNIASSQTVDILLKNIAAIIILPFGVFLVLSISETFPSMLNKNKNS